MRPNLLLLAALSATLIAPLQGALPSQRFDYFHAQGRHIVADSSKEPMLFRCLNLGGLEFGSFMRNDYPGVEGTNYFLPRPQDFFKAAQAGMNCVRIPFEWSRLVPGWHPGRELPSSLAQEYVEHLDQTIARAAGQGLQVVLDAHSFLKYWPGKNQLACLDDPNDPQETVYRRLFARVWKLIALRYRSQPAVLGYDLMNEPVRHTLGSPDPNKVELCQSCNWHEIAQEAIEAIRDVDRRHLIFVEGRNFALASHWTLENGFDAFVIDRDSQGKKIEPPRLVYSPHLYFDLANKSKYLDERGERKGPIGPWKEYLRDRLMPVLGFSFDNQVPIFIGELGVPCSPQWGGMLKHAFDEYFLPYRLSTALWNYVDPERCPLGPCPLNVALCEGGYQLQALQEHRGGPYRMTGRNRISVTDSRIFDEPEFPSEESMSSEGAGRLDARVHPWDAGLGSFRRADVQLCAADRPAFSGDCSLRVDFDSTSEGGYAAVKLIHHTGIDSRRYRSLRFRILLTGRARQNLKISTTSPRSDCDQDRTDAIYPPRYEWQPELRDYLLRATPDRWHEVEVPLADVINPRKPILNGIVFQNMGRDLDPIYFDDIRLVH